MIEAAAPVIHTLGHSTRSFDELGALLRAHHITLLADVRSIPKSRRHPHFAREALAKTLPPAGIDYRHFPGLGGLRKPRADSINAAWRNGGFRGFADYMQTPGFAEALNELLREASRHAVAIMCAEAVWWRCHRQLIADALVARGIEVRHIASESSAPAHTLTAFARLTDAGVTYPGLLED
jgi:uncharacterized protein (DUF488 family)